MGLLLSKISQIAIFVICAQTVLHFRAKESYEKYLKLLVSLMVLLLFAEPIMGVFGSKGNMEFLENVNRYENELQEIFRNPQLDNEEIVEILSNMTARLSEQVQTVEKVEVTLEYGTSQEFIGE